MSFWSAVGKFFLDVGKAVVKYAINNPVSFTLQAATLVVGVKGFMQAKNMLAKGQDILANKQSAGGKIPVIYGTRRVGAQIVYMDVNANDSRDLYVVYALSVGEVDEIIGKTIELDGNRLTDSARFRDGGYIGSDKISSGAGSLNTVSQNGTGIDAGAGQFGSSPTSKYRYVMNLHHGAASQTADPMLVASMSNWTSTHKLNGIAYIACHFGYDKEGIWSGVPQLTVQVRGKKVYDPRSGETAFTDSTGKVIGDNPALCFLDYITNDEYGKGLTTSQINMTTFGAAATVCETQVDQPYFNGTAKSLTWSGTAGDDFITIGGSSANEEWYQNKIAELIDLFDANGNNVLDGLEIKEIQRTNYFGSTENFRIFFNGTLGSTYSPQTGTSLLKVKRFQCNGYLDTNKNVMENAKELLANMRGIFLYINGKYELSIEDTGSSTFSINDNHIIADAGISVDYGNKDKKANKVIVEFFNANKKYELDTATVLHDATPEYYSDDNDEILEIKAEFPYISDPYIAYNMGKAILTRSRNQTTMQFLGTPEMYKLNVGDIVDLTYAGLGFSGKVCRVEALELQPNGLVAVSLIEYFDVYTWEVPPQEPVEELANLPSAYAVKAPTNITFTDTDSSSTGRPFLSWDEPTDFPDYQYRVNVVDNSGNQVINRIVDVENCDLNFVPTGSYVANITSLNTLGTESSPARFPTSGTFTIGDAPVIEFDIADAAVVTDKINNGAVTNVKINDLSAGKINTGELNLGQESGMAVRQTKTGYTSTATGFWLGNDGGTPKFNIGTSTNYLKFDGTDLDISGEISATTGSIGGFSVGETSLTAGTGTSRISLSTTDGIHLGDNTFSSAPFRVELDGSLTATDATVTGTLTLTNIDGATVVYSGGNLVVGTIGGSNLGSSAIFPTTLRYERSNSTSAPSDAEFNTAFNRNPRSNDIVVVTRTDTNAQVAYKHNGTSFSAVTNYIDGDLIVDGSITADQIEAGTLTSASGVFGSISANDIDTGTLNAANVTISGGDVTINSSGITINGSSSSINLGSGAFTVSTAGVISATSGEVGGFTLGSTSLTNTEADSKIQIGSGSDVFTVDGDGIYLGNTSFASAPFKALNTGEVQTTKSFTAGVAGSGEIAKMAGTGDYRFWSGNEAPANASFSVDKAGKVIAKNLVLKLTDGTVYFDSETGFSNSALSQISLTTGTKVSTVSNTFDADTEYEEITVTEDTDVDVSVSIDTNFGGNSDDSSTNTAIDESEAEIPENFTLTIQHSSDGGSNYTTVVTDTFTRVNDRLNPKTTPLSDEYKINTETEQLFIGGQGGVIIIATTTTSLNLGCVDSDGRTILAYTGLTLTGISTGTTHRIKATVSTTDTSYDTTNNNVSSTAPRVVSITDPSGGGFYVGDGSGSQVAPEGDITRVQITTASNSGLTGGANFASGDALFTLALASSIDGAKTFTNNVVIQGNLDVQGTTTTIDTTNLDVKDKNITLNYGTGDTSANANGAGITIQDAVSAGNDATLTWNTSTDKFEISHGLDLPDSALLRFGNGADLRIYHSGSHSYIDDAGTGNLYIRAADSLYLQKYTGETFLQATADGEVRITHNNNTKLATTSTGIDVTGTATMDGLTVDGDITVNDSSPMLTLTDTDGTNQLGRIFQAGATLYINSRDNTSFGAIDLVAANGSQTYNRLTINSGGDISFYEDTGTTAKFFWDASAERLGIGTTSPNVKLVVNESSGDTAIAIDNARSNVGDFARLNFRHNGITGSQIKSQSIEDFSVSANRTSNLEFHVRNNGTQIQAATIDPSGALLLGKTSADFGSTEGLEVRTTGNAYITAQSVQPLRLRRTSTDGDIAVFQKDTTTVGSIGNNGSRLFAGSGATGLMYDGTNNYIVPWNTTTNAGRDGAIDLGVSPFRFKDLYLSGTISSGAITSTGNITLAEYLYHNGNTGTNLRFLTDRAILTSGGGAIVDAHSNGNLYLTGTTVQVYGNYNSSGTISSGAIDSSGTSNFDSIQLTDASRLGFGTVKSGATVGHTSSTEEGIFWHTTNQYGIYRTAGVWSSPNYQQLKIKFDTGIEIDGAGTTYGKSGINFLNGNIKMDGTQILDASRNLSNIGTISSGAITSTGTVTADGLAMVSNGILETAGDFHMYAVGDLRFYLDINNNGADEFQVFGNVAEGTTTGALFTIQDTGNVGIGTDSPVSYQTGPVLNVGNTSNTYAQINLTSSTSGKNYIGFGDATSGTGRYQGLITYDHSANIMGFGTAASTSYQMAIDSSGSLLVGGTSAFANDTTTINSSGLVYASRNSNKAGHFNRQTSDGEIVVFSKDGTTVGSIGSHSGIVTKIVLDPRTNGASLTGGTNKISPGNQSGAVDAYLDIGSIGNRFKDLYLSGTARSNTVSINGTTVIDSSRNLTNIGTISSGQVTITQTHPTVFLQESGGGNTNAAYLQKYNNDLYLYNKEANGSLFLGTNNGTKLTINNAGTATFSGDISSGAITSSGLLNLGGTGSLGSITTNQKILANFDGGYSTNNSAQNKVVGFIGTTKSTLNIFDSSYGTNGELQKNFYLGLSTGNSYFNNAKFVIVQGGVQRFAMAQGGNVTLSGTITSSGYTVSGTTVIDASRNLTNIGTISSGAITSTGNITSSTTGTGNAKLIADGGGAANVEIDRGSTSYHNNLLYRTAGAVKWRIWQSGADNILAIRNEVASTNVLSFTDTNATFAGTISSGGHTITNGNQLKVYRSGDSAYVGLYMDTGENAILFNSWGSKYLTLTRDGDLKLTNTTFLDSARNLTNIGTISSGGITATDTYGGGSGDYTNITTPQLKIVAEGSSYFRIPHISGSSTISGVYNYEDNKDVFWGEPNDSGTYHFRGRTLNISDSELAINGTTVIDGSRNLTNIGTINSGDITTTGIQMGSGTSNDIQANGKTAYIGSAIFGNSAANNVPATAVHIKGSGTPTLRIEDLDSTNQVYDFISNYGVGLSIVDQTSSITPLAFAHTTGNATFAGTLGSGTITSTGNVTAYSDERLKTNIQTLDSKKALQMRGVSFIKDGVKGSGVIAQEIEEIAPELVLTADDEVGTKSVAYGNLVGYLIEAIKDQQQQIDELKAKIENGSS